MCSHNGRLRKGGTKIMEVRPTGNFICTRQRMRIAGIPKKQNEKNKSRKKELHMSPLKMKGRIKTLN